MNVLQVFDHIEFGKIRAVERNGEPWLVGKDVAQALGYKNPQEAIRDHVDPEDKGVSEILTPGGKQAMPIINESGLYSLIMGSKLHTAKKFKHWVTSEVLPTIRRHGAYMTPDTLEAMIADPDTAIRLLAALKSEQEQRKALEVKAAENAPKVLFADSVSASKDSIPVGELAKLLNQNGVDIGRNLLFRWFREKGYLIKRGREYNLPTQKSMDRGLFQIKETAITHSDGYISTKGTTVVTGKGQQYFINLFLGKIVELGGEVA